MISAGLHVRIIGASTAFGYHPIDVLGGILDVARLAMDAVLGVDDELRVAFFLADDLVNARRAITLRRLVVHRQIVIDRNIGIAQRQVERLILLMVGIQIGRASGRERVCQSGVESGGCRVIKKKKTSKMNAVS